MGECPSQCTPDPSLLNSAAPFFFVFIVLLGQICVRRSVCLFPAIVLHSTVLQYRYMRQQGHQQHALTGAASCRAFLAPHTSHAPRRTPQVLMFASKYKGGISKNRIIKAFDFLKQRSDEAALAARREAAVLRKQQEKQQAQDDADAAAAAAAEGGDGQKGEEEKSDQEVFALKRKPWEKNAKSTLPEGGAGLVSLMGDMSSLEQRIQGEWTLAIKAGGRCVWCWRLLLGAYGLGVEGRQRHLLRRTGKYSFFRGARPL